MSTPATASSNPTLTCLYPDEILDAYKLVEPHGYITIRGVVTGLRPHKNICVYGDIKGRERSISFRCPPDHSPTELHEHVIIGGFLSVKSSPLHNGLDVELRGEVIGTWNGFDDDKDKYIIPERKRPKTPLTQFVRNYRKNLPNLLVAGTKRALLDYRSALELKEAVPWNEVVVNVSEIETFIQDLDAAIAEYDPKAIAVVRGGAETNKGMQLWNNARVIDYLLSTERFIYSGIGHADGYVILDQYADQSFNSPSDFGHSLINEIRQLETEDQLARKYYTIAHDNKSLSERIENLQQEHEDDLDSIKDLFSQQIAEHKQHNEQNLQRLQKRNNIMMIATVAMATTLLFLFGIYIFQNITVI